MRNKSRLLISLVLGLSALQGCSTIDSKSAAETQSADKAPVVTSLPAPAPVPAPQQTAVAVAASPVAEKAPVVTEQCATTDRYTVVAGDTLSTIAGKKEVYGDTRLWPLLQRANSSQVGPQGLLSIGQVLTINRNYSTEEKTALIGKARTAKPATSIVVNTPSMPSAPAATAPSTTAVATPAAAPATQAVADVTPAASSPAVATATQSAAPAAVPTNTAAVTKTPATSADRAANPMQGAKPAEILNAGRRAFAAGDFPWATYYYNAYLGTQKRDANAWGELGNVFFSMGNTSDSAQAYFTAANLLIDQGRTAQAIQLVPAIEAGNPGLAEALHTRLTTVRR